MKRKFVSFFSVFLSLLLLLPLPAYAVNNSGLYFDNSNGNSISQTVLDEVDYIVQNVDLKLNNSYRYTFYITCDDDDNIFFLSCYWNYQPSSVRNLTDLDVNALIVVGQSRCQLYQWDYTNKVFNQVSKDNIFYGPDSISSEINNIAASQNISGVNVYAGSALIYYNSSSDQSLLRDGFSAFFLNNPWYLGGSNSGDDSGGESGDGGYNDSSFKSLISELFDHLFGVLLYGNDDDYDGTDVEDSIEWLDELSESMEDISDKLDDAPDYISNGFTAVTSAQDGINDLFEGIATAVPVLYYGIIGLLNIILIRKIIGR